MRVFMFMKFLNRRHFTTISKWKCVSIMKKDSDGGMTGAAMSSPS